MTSFRNGDLLSAMAPLRRAAEAGHAPAQTTLAYILDLGEYNEEAVRYYQMAADQKYPPGIHGLASMVLSGDGVEQDATRAYALFLEAASLGYDPSWAALADALLNKHMAPPTTPPTAETILTKAADTGYLRAADALAKNYATGGLDLPKDAAKAAQWTQRAIELRGATQK
ncbi:MAG: sel1 repeat family protein [Rhodocyclaceae bacterium]|nr:sel1 repeat family protein [Rhodocyclaceae bacterium]